MRKVKKKYTLFHTIGIKNTLSSNDFMRPFFCDIESEHRQNKKLNINQKQMITSQDI